MRIGFYQIIYDADEKDKIVQSLRYDMNGSNPKLEVTGWMHVIDTMLKRVFPEGLPYSNWKKSESSIYIGTVSITTREAIERAFVGLSRRELVPENFKNEVIERLRNDETV